MPPTVDRLVDCDGVSRSAPAMVLLSRTWRLSKRGAVHVRGRKSASAIRLWIRTDVVAPSLCRPAIACGEGSQPVVTGARTRRTARNVWRKALTDRGAANDRLACPVHVSTSSDGEIHLNSSGGLG